MGAYSWNNEVKKAVGSISDRFEGKGAFLIDREADGEILKDFFFQLPNQCIVRLKRNTSIFFKNEKLQVSKMVKKMHFDIQRKVVKVKKNKKVARTYKLAAAQVDFRAKGKTHRLGWWSVATRNTGDFAICW